MLVLITKKYMVLFVHMELNKETCQRKENNNKIIYHPSIINAHVEAWNG